MGIYINMREENLYGSKPRHKYITACGCKDLDKFGNCPRGFFPYFINGTIDGNTPEVGDTFIYPNGDKVKVHKVEKGFPTVKHDVESTTCGSGLKGFDYIPDSETPIDKALMEEINRFKNLL